MFTLLLIAAIGVSHLVTVSTAAYVRTGECADDQVCQYSYSADQQHGDDTSNDIIASATVDIMCQSVGTYDGSVAKHFCMHISDAHIEGTIVGDDPAKINENFGKLLASWFCFVQTEDGKVVAVHHPRTESQNTVDFKRAIAAAFQANFKGTTEEMESDPQSTHMSHYTHEASTESDHHVKKMHRHIDTDEVIDSASEVGKRKIKFLKDEDIEYRDGVLRRSSGRAEVKMAKEVIIQQQGRRLSEGFSATGSYTLELEQCYIPSGNMLQQRRMALREVIGREMSEESLRANNGMLRMRRRQDQDELIREEFPSVTGALMRLHKDPDNVKIFDKISNLLELENELGPPPGKTPVLDDILNYFQMIRNSQQAQDVTMRSVIYSLLSDEGSLKSQRILLRALKHTINDHERDSIILSIAMVKNARREFVNDLKGHITNQEKFNVASLESLLLAMGALASKSEENIQLDIARFLITAVSRENLDISVTVLIRAMGNTGSEEVVATILHYVDDPVKSIQAAALSALVKFTHLEQVLDDLRELIRSGSDEELLNQVARTLIQGRIYADLMDIDTSTIASHPILRSLLSEALRTNDTDLIRQVSMYLRDLGGELATTLLSQLYLRFRRGTDWDASNRDYNCVASQSSRASDVNTYQRHKAYIYGKTFGNDEVNLNIGAGVFLGISDDCNNMKGFARACAAVTVFSYTEDLAEIEFLVVKSGSKISGRAYAQIAGNTLMSYSRSVDATYCFSYERSVVQRNIKLFSFSYSIFIFIGTLDASISLYLFFGTTFDAEMCASLDLDELLTATTAIIPELGITVEGTASATILGLTRVGFTAEATISYAIEPRGSGKACATSCTSADYQTCVGVYHFWPGNEISLYAFYQFRRLKWCKGWWGIPYPCRFGWGSKKKWSALSWTWEFGRSSKKALVEACYPSNSGCSASPVD